MAEASIAKVLMKRRKQIAGIVGRSPYANRSSMTKEQRQAALNDLMAVRFGADGKPVDGGILDRIPLTVIDLRGKQQKGKGN